jgi:hypothetical protein
MTIFKVAFLALDATPHSKCTAAAVVFTRLHFRGRCIIIQGACILIQGARTS